MKRNPARLSDVAVHAAFSGDFVVAAPLSGESVIKAAARFSCRRSFFFLTEVTDHHGCGYWQEAP